MELYLHLPLIGIFSGFLAGLFGVGGGLITVPLLLSIGIPIKFAVGISTMQMVASSYFGTFLNRKTTDTNLKQFIPLGIGGLLGGIVGGNILNLIADKYISYIFIVIILFALLKVYFSKHTEEKRKNIPIHIMIALGLSIGVISSMLGIGGTIFLIPVLIGFFGFTTKSSSVISLFFVIFTSTSSFITLYYLGYVDLLRGGIVAVFSLIGVKIGLWVTNKVSHSFHKKLVIMLYIGLLLLIVGNFN